MSNKVLVSTKLERMGCVELSNLIDELNPALVDDEQDMQIMLSRIWEILIRKQLVK